MDRPQSCKRLSFLVLVLSAAVLVLVLEIPMFSLTIPNPASAAGQRPRLDGTVVEDEDDDEDDGRLDRTCGEFYTPTSHVNSSRENS